MKKLIAILLLACMLLTLASCGKKDEGPAARTFTFENEAAKLTVIVDGSDFTVQATSKVMEGGGKVTRQANGTYFLEYCSERVGNVTLEAVGDGLYKITGAERDYEDEVEILSSIRIKLNEDGTYSTCHYRELTYGYKNAGNNDIIRAELYGDIEEVWEENNRIIPYEGMKGTYTQRESGKTKNVDITFNGETISGSLEGETLTLTDGYANVVFNLMGENTYVATLEDALLALRLKENGVAEWLEGDEYNVKDGSITCVPGEKLEIIFEGELVLSLVIEGDKLVMVGEAASEFNDEERVTLTEVK